MYLCDDVRACERRVTSFCSFIDPHLQGLARTTTRDRLEDIFPPYYTYVWGECTCIMYAYRANSCADYMCTGSSGEGVNIYIIDRYVVL